MGEQTLWENLLESFDRELGRASRIVNNDTLKQVEVSIVFAVQILAEIIERSTLTPSQTIELERKLSKFKSVQLQPELTAVLQELHTKVS